ncbi:autotransporter outer membrane beta-barrel domain-containing protein [uncultured Cohaesibacter sp.]|uniref:autotransporter family protein n=1 Tax=uncultured Cohaesibacter sp. TaxID=1002546 RepID=UPI0029C8C2BE|nr:autotransporter outer membrane beta-barrel domain-containing protein [uncultured Cohaesibacter sp.]
MNKSLHKLLLQATGFGFISLATAPAFATGLITSTFTVTEDDASVNQANLGNPNQGWFTAGTSGSYSYNYVAIDFTADTTGTYTFGQTAGPIDTVMAVYYDSSFDADNLVNPDAYNDDSALSGDLCGGYGCPAVQATLDADLVNTLVISTFSNGALVTLPLSFYASGVGNITFTVNPSSGTEFFVPVSEANRTDDMAAIMDSIASGSTSASTALTNSLTSLAVGSEASRTSALQNISPNASVAVSTVTTQVMQTGFSRIDSRMASVRASASNSVGTSTSTHGSDYVTAYAEDDSDQDSRFEAFSLFDKQSEPDILKSNVWGEFSVFQSQQDADDGYAGFESTSQSFMFGFDSAITERIFAGIALSYTATDVNMKDFREGDSVDSDSYQATLYGSYEFAEDWLLGGKFSYARHEMDSSRNTVTSTAYGSYGVNQFGVQADISRSFAFSNGLTLLPKVGLSYINLQQEAYSETGSALALSYDSLSSDQFYSSVSLEVSKSFDLGEKALITPNVAVGWNHNYLTDGTDMVARFVGGGGDFTSPGQALEEDSLSLNAGLSINYDRNLTIDVDATGAFAPNYNEYGAKARLTYSF